MISITPSVTRILSPARISCGSPRLTGHSGAYVPVPGDTAQIRAVLYEPPRATVTVAGL